MYTANLLFVVEVSLLLGSLYGILVGLVFMVVLARRAVLEVHTFQQEPRGYTAYMGQVKYRLIPFIW